jgi:type II secretory pathway pseudopilin PulG
MKKERRKFRSGLTPCEALILLVVISILAVALFVFLPKSINKSMWREADDNMKLIATAIDDYHKKNGPDAPPPKNLWEGLPRSLDLNKEDFDGLNFKHTDYDFNIASWDPNPRIWKVVSKNDKLTPSIKVLTHDGKLIVDE